MFIFDPDADGTEAPRCSAKGCSSDATMALRWNNPKIHTPDRRKIWVACDVHTSTLSEFLSLRGFLKNVVPLSEVAGEPG